MRNISALKKNALLNLIVHASNTIFPMLSIVYLTGVLTQISFGMLSFALGIGQVFVMISDYGLNLTATKEIAKKNSNMNKAELIVAVTVIKTGLAITCYTTIMAICFISEKIESVIGLIFISSGIVIGNILSNLWYFQAEGDLKGVTILQIISRLFGYIGILLFVTDDIDLNFAALFMGLSQLITGVGCVLLILYSVQPCINLENVKKNIKFQLRSGGGIFAGMLFANVYSSWNLMILGFIVPSQQLAIYNIADKLIKAIQSVYGQISLALYPHAVKLASNSPESLIEYNKNIAIKTTLVGILVVGTVAFWRNELILIMFGPEYFESARIVLILCLLPIIVMLSNIAGVQTMLPLGLNKQFISCLFGGSMIYMCSIFTISQNYGVLGSSYVVVVTELLVLGFMASQIHKKYKL